MTAQLQHARVRPPPPALAPRLRRAEKAWQEGLRCAQKGQHAAASQAFRRALNDAPADAAYWMQLARSEFRLHHTTACHEAIRQALACVDLSNWTYAYCLVVLFQQVQDPAGVLDVLDGYAAGREHITMAASWQIERATALTELRRSEAALACGMLALTHSMQGDAGSADQRALRRRAALLNGHNLAEQKRHTEAAICYRMAVDAEPMSVGCALYAAHYSAWTCDWVQLNEDLERLQSAVLAVDALPAGSGQEELSPFSLIGLSDDPIFMRWAAEHANPLMAARSCRMARPATAVPRPGGRLRIGLLSSDFFLHATAILIAEMLESIDRDRYELYFYDNSPDDGSEMRGRLLATATQVHAIFSWSDGQVIEQIRTDQIGVLVDLKGFTNGARMGVLAARAAPLQVAWLGYPGTCGNTAIDYQIGDAVVTPLAHQDDFTECIAQLPCCYQPNDSTRSLPPTWSRADCGLPQDGLVLGSFNQVYKTTEPVFTAWCEVLLAVPQAVLWLLVRDELTQQRLRSYAGALGVAAERIVFAPYVDADSHRARIGQADLVLDTFPCGGHTTTSDLLWAGVPVLTLCGRTFAARVAASLLTHLGLPDLVCHSLDQYRDTAIALCQDEGALARLRQRVAQGRVGSGLFDGERFAQHWQDLIERMVARQNSGLPPTALAAMSADAPVVLANQQLLCRDNQIAAPVVLRRSPVMRLTGDQSVDLKVAFITPYFKESREMLQRCIDSVSAQQAFGVQITHIMVADGHPQDWLDGQAVRHLRLDVSHQDFGNTPRALGGLMAASEGFDAIGFIDADNWLAADHVAHCLSTVAAAVGPVDYVIARRHLVRMDGSVIPLQTSDDQNGSHVDTNCFLMMPGSFHTLGQWAVMPKPLSCVGDRVFLNSLRQQRLRAVVTSHPTVHYLCTWACVFTAIGETVPAYAKSSINLGPTSAWWRGLDPRDRELAQRLAATPVDYWV